MMMLLLDATGGTGRRERRRTNTNIHYLLHTNMKSPVDATRARRIRRFSNQTKSYIIRLTTHSKNKQNIQKNKTQSTCKCIYYSSSWHYSAVLWLGFATPESMQYHWFKRSYNLLAGQQKCFLKDDSLMTAPAPGRSLSLLPPLTFFHPSWNPWPESDWRFEKRIAYLQACIEHTNPALNRHLRDGNALMQQKIAT